MLRKKTKSGDAKFLARKKRRLCSFFFGGLWTAESDRADWISNSQSQRVLLSLSLYFKAWQNVNNKSHRGCLIWLSSFIEEIIVCAPHNYHSVESARDWFLVLFSFGGERFSLHLMDCLLLLSYRENTLEENKDLRVHSHRLLNSLKASYTIHYSPR